MALNRDQILASRTLATETVPVPEWGGDVQVRVMSGIECAAFEKDQHKRGDTDTLDNFRARVLVRCVCDESGALLFTPADADALGTQDGNVLKRLFDVAAKLNGLTAEAKEEAAKN